MDKPCNKKFGILVHQLPLDHFNDAIALFQSEDIENVNHSASGLRVYFKQWEAAERCISEQRYLRVGDYMYDVCTLQTSLTLHGVREPFSESTIREMMNLYGPVSDIYPVATISKYGKSWKSSLSNDYRVVLDVPEVLANFSLDPLRFENHSFRVSFFCRICRQNEHKSMNHSETVQWNESASSSYERPSTSYEIPRRLERPNQRYSSFKNGNEAARINISPEEFEEENNAGCSPYQAGFGQPEMSPTSPFVNSELTPSFTSDDFQTEENCSTRSENLKKRSSGKDRSATAHSGKRSFSDARRDNPSHKKSKVPTKKIVTKKTVTKKTKPTKRKKIVELSPGIKTIVSKSEGVLTEARLYNFLNQVRGRKKQLEVADQFTDDIPGLIRQLKALVKDYYVCGRRGKREDLDINFIKGLHVRLEQKYQERERAGLQKSRLTNPHVRSSNSRDESAVSEKSARKVAENSKKMSRPVFSPNSSKSTKKMLPENRYKKYRGVSPPSTQLRGRKIISGEHKTIIQSNMKQRTMSAKKSVPGSTQTVNVDSSSDYTRQIAKKNLIDKKQSYLRPNSTQQRVKMSSDLKSQPGVENCPSTSKKFYRN